MHEDTTILLHMNSFEKGSELSLGIELTEEDKGAFVPYSLYHCMTTS